MPMGGMKNLGSGLRLQSSSPGQQDVGNANINGVMIAHQFTTSPAGVGVGNDNELFGHDLVAGGNNRQILFGNGCRTGAQIQTFAGGYSCTAYPQQSFAFGLTCIAGYVNDFGARKVALGEECSAGASVGDPSLQVAMGCLASASGGVDTSAAGCEVNIKGSQTNLGTCVGFGARLATGGTIPSEEVALHGIGIDTGPGFIQNVLVLGVYIPGGLSGAFPGVTSNSILIGNAAQTKVKIGPYTIAQTLGGPASVNDANYVWAAGIGRVQYSAITAARVVSAPAANSLPAGSRISVTDFSGSVTGVNTITINAAGADTINGLASVVISTAYGHRELETNGVNKWTIVQSL